MGKTLTGFLSKLTASEKGTHQQSGNHNNKNIRLPPCVVKNIPVDSARELYQYPVVIGIVVKNACLKVIAVIYGIVHAELLSQCKLEKKAR